MSDDLTDGESDEDDFAMRDVDLDDPRADLGYGPAPAPIAPISADVTLRSAPPPPPERPSKLTHGACRASGCDAEGPLYPTPWSADRTHCSACSGRTYRERVEEARDTIRLLKAASAQGHAEEERRLYKHLSSLVGEHQARESANAIQATLDEKPAARGRR